MTDNYYDTHIFCCTNERPEGHERGCCKAKGAEKIRNYMKARVKELGIEKTRVNASGCLDRCELGPTIVIYPEGVWYRCGSIADAEEIIQNHILKKQPVERLRLKNDQKNP